MWQKKGAVYDSLDEWLVGLGKYVLDPKALFEEKRKQASCFQNRKELCEEGLRMRLQKPKTFHTYVNGLGRVYSQVAGTNAFTPSNKSVFPEYANSSMHLLGGDVS